MYPLKTAECICFYIIFRHNKGHVSRAQLRQVLTTASMLLSEEEEFALEQRYNNDLGFNYMWFLTELESKKIEKPLYNYILKETRKINAEKPPPEVDANEKNIVLILAKIKAKVVRERVKVNYLILKCNLHRKLYQLRINGD